MSKFVLNNISWVAVNLDCMSKFVIIKILLPSIIWFIVIFYPNLIYRHISRSKTDKMKIVLQLQSSAKGCILLHWSTSLFILNYSYELSNPICEAIPPPLLMNVAQPVQRIKNILSITSTSINIILMYKTQLSTQVF